jgi:hypothetical protein
MDLLKVYLDYRNFLGGKGVGRAASERPGDFCDCAWEAGELLPMQHCLHDPNEGIERAGFKSRFCLVPFYPSWGEGGL